MNIHPDDREEPLEPQLTDRDREVFRQILIAREHERTERVKMVLGFCFFVVIAVLIAVLSWAAMA